MQLVVCKLSSSMPAVVSRWAMVQLLGMAEKAKKVESGYLRALEEGGRGGGEDKCHGYWIGFCQEQTPMISLWLFLFHDLFALAGCTRP